MAKLKLILLSALSLIVSAGAAGATPVYWNLFNIEEENQQNAVYITYASLDDMLNDTNRTGSFVPDAVGNSAENVVGSGSDGLTYWNLFNIEEENQQNAVYITYASLDDMLNDTNRTGSFVPDAVGNSAENVVGSGSDGLTYWNLFNIEEENQQNSVYITYASLDDMLNDTNRTGSFVADTVGNSAENVVGSGSDGLTYWNLFNIEEENQQNAVYITYASLDDMLNDTNRTGSFVPDTVGNSAENVVGSGAFVVAATEVPAPPALALLGAGLAGLVAGRRRKKG
jgi:hypothetical protein